MSLQLIISGLAIGLLAVSGYGDLRTRRIPNELCLAIAALGAADLTIAGNPLGALYTVGADCAIFCVCFILFACGALGGGDVKLIAATVLLVGYRDLVEFLFIMSICGAALGIVAFARTRIGPWLEHFSIGIGLSWERLASANLWEGQPDQRLGPVPAAAPAAGAVGSSTIKGLSVPYGVAVAAAGIVTLFLQIYLTR